MGTFSFSRGGRNVSRSHMTCRRKTKDVSVTVVSDGKRLKLPPWSSGLQGGGQGPRWTPGSGLGQRSHLLVSNLTFPVDLCQLSAPGSDPKTGSRCDQDQMFLMATPDRWDCFSPLAGVSRFSLIDYSLSVGPKGGHPQLRRHPFLGLCRLTSSTGAMRSVNTTRRCEIRTSVCV